LEPHWYPTECREHGRWFHIPDDHFYAEVRDPETGEGLEEGERGELIVTALSYETMAHICWAHDDIAKIQRGTCACGRTGTRIKILGRIGDLVNVAGKRLLPWDVLLAVEDIDEMPGNLFQFYPDSTEELRLRIGYAPDRTGDIDALTDRFEDIIGEAVEVPVTVADTMTEAELSELGPPHKIPRVVNE
jgi:phenylacetate-CoA ligase